MNDVRKFRAVVIGTGAGGAPAAARLAKHWGDGVAILEAGPYLHANDFNQLEADMVPRVYAGGGLQGTEDGAISVLQGRCVGGSTVVNDALCFRPPEELEPRWRKHGVAYSHEGLLPYVDEVEHALSVSPLERDFINRSNYLVGLGAARLGWQGERLRHNAVNCVQCGFRHFGCAYNAKKSMNLTFIPQAVALGAQLFPETPALRLERRNGSWLVHTPKSIVEAEHVVVAAGVTQTPTLLLRSGMRAGGGLQFHLATVAWGDFDEPVDYFNGIPMSYGVTEFSDVYGHTGPGYLIEGVGHQPVSFSVQPQLQGAVYEELLQRYRHLSASLLILRSKARGRISLGENQRTKIDYPVVFDDAVRIEHFYQKIVELYQAAGAKRTLLAHRDFGWLTTPPKSVTVEAGRQYLYTPHPFGGACRGNAEFAATDSVGRVKGEKNLWVMDASAFPEAPGVNPQVTIAALSLEGADRLVSEA